MGVAEGALGALQPSGPQVFDEVGGALAHEGVDVEAHQPRLQRPALHAVGDEPLDEHGIPRDDPDDAGGGARKQPQDRAAEPAQRDDDDHPQECQHQGVVGGRGCLGEVERAVGTVERRDDEGAEHGEADGNGTDGEASEGGDDQLRGRHAQPLRAEREPRPHGARGELGRHEARPEEEGEEAEEVDALPSRCCGSSRCGRC